MSGAPCQMIVRRLSGACQMPHQTSVRQVPYVHLQPATVKEILIILVSLAWPEIARGSQKTPKSKMCLFFNEAIGRLIIIFTSVAS